MGRFRSLPVFLGLAVCLVEPGALSAQNECPPVGSGSGAILYGDDFALMIAAPPGWVVDCGIGHQLGALTVMYPKDPGWKDAPAIMYVAFIDKEDSLSLQAAVAQDLKRSRAESPSIEVEQVDDLPAGDTKAQVYHTSNDRWGNHDLVAFIDQPNVVITIAMSARTAEAFAANRPLFEKVVASYAYIVKQPGSPSGPSGGGSAIRTLPDEGAI